jgi:hypothetical protein
MPTKVANSFSVIVNFAAELSNDKLHLSFVLEQALPAVVGFVLRGLTVSNAVRFKTWRVVFCLRN